MNKPRLSPQFGVQGETGRGNIATLRFGEATGATDGLDPSLGEYELPPLPPSGAYDIRWIVAGLEGTSVDYRDTLNAQRKRNVWRARIQPGAGGYPVTITWNKANLWDGFFHLHDVETSGATFSVDMKLEGSVTITSTTIRTLEIVRVFKVATSIHLAAGWNLVSVPVEVRDWRKAILFPSVTTPIYRYTGTYVATDTLQRHPGYWVRADSAYVVQVLGEPFAVGTFLVQEGWNMLGSIFSDVDVENIVQVPSGIVSSFFFGYSDGYRPTTVISAGRGHWVKTNQSGKIVSGTNALGKRALTLHHRHRVTRIGTGCGLLMLSIESYYCTSLQSVKRRLGLSCPLFRLQAFLMSGLFLSGSPRRLVSWDKNVRLPYRG